MEGRGEKRKKKDQEKKELFIFFGFRLRNSSSAFIQFKFHSIFVFFFKLAWEKYERHRIRNPVKLGNSFSTASTFVFQNKWTLTRAFNEDLSQ